MNDVFKIQVENITDRLRNLELAHEANLSSIARKDKKIDGLKTELHSEKNRRQHAEGETRKANQLMVESRDEFNRKFAELNEIANFAQTQYDVVAKSGQRERVDMQRKLHSIRSDISSLKKSNEKKTVQLQRLDAIMAQKNREIEASRESFDRLVSDYAAYKSAHDGEVREMIERAHKNETKLDEAFASLKETEGRMRWAVNRTNITDTSEEKKRDLPSLGRSKSNALA